MEIYNIENLTFTYPNRTEPALRGISLTVSSGEFITVCGSSGCGKTTLLRLMKPIIAPSGTCTGKILFCDESADSLSMKRQAAEIGFVMQDPDNQTVTDKVWHEMAFGLEGLGAETGEIRTRVAEMASYLGIQGWFHKSVSELSGGQKQILGLASVMVMRPSVLILDEPTAQLDPIAANEFLGVLERINREFGTTVILSEHRLDDVMPVSDRVIVLENGEIIADGTPQTVGERLQDNKMYMALPVPMRVYYSVGGGKQCPVSVRSGRIWLEEYTKTVTPDRNAIPRTEKAQDGAAGVELSGIWLRYEKNKPDIIKGLDMTVGKGEIFALLGGNAAGKTTLLSVIGGIMPPYRGRVKVNGTVGILPQDPRTLFVKNTVYSDLAEVLSDRKMTDGEKEETILKTAALCRISELLKYHPYDLSGGEQQRAALAKLLLTNPDILLADEPTKGCDAHFKRIFAEILKDLKRQGKTVLIASHDIEFCSEYSDRCAMLFDGNITACAPPREFFGKNSFYTTAAARMASQVLPEAILADDIILALGGSIKNWDSKPPKPPETEQTAPPPQTKIKNTRKTSISSALLFITAAITAAVGIYCFGDRKYYFISLLIMAQMLIPFCIQFEKKGHHARELVLISVLCAMGVIGRVAFFMLPEAKPMTAIVIISGAAMGMETGAAVGAVSALVSNFFFGQGPWTPWQMLAFGLIGFLSGLCLCGGKIKRTRLSLSIFGFLSALLVYGGIINPASVIMWEPMPTREMIAASYVSGFPIDLIHAAATAVFLWFLSKPMTEKIDRVRVKYEI